VLSSEACKQVANRCHAVPLQFTECKANDDGKWQRMNFVTTPYYVRKDRIGVPEYKAEMYMTLIRLRWDVLRYEITALFGATMSGQL
jgi:hypothetical protein